jgi:hypothetical protein
VASKWRARRIIKAPPWLRFPYVSIHFVVGSEIMLNGYMK